MILCHKCSGILANSGKDSSGLFGCACISGYVRGFEKVLNREQAINAQIRASRWRIDLIAKQGGTEEAKAPYIKRLANLQALLG